MKSRYRTLCLTLIGQTQSLLSSESFLSESEDMIEATAKTIEHIKITLASLQSELTEIHSKSERNRKVIEVIEEQGKEFYY